MNYRGGYGDSVEEAASLFSTRSPWQVGPVNANGNVNAEAAGAAAGQGAIIFQGFLGGRGYGGNIMQPISTGRWDLNPVSQLEGNHTSGNQRDDNQDQQQAKWNVNPNTARLRDDDELLGFSVDQRSAQQTDAHKSTTCTVIYKECQKNQALDTATHSVDGCGEFMRRGKEGQEALQCMACGCHRSYHRSVIVDDNGKELETEQDLHISLSRIETVALNLMEATGRALPLLAAGGGVGADDLQTVLKISIENLDHISKVTLSTVECISILQQAAGTTTANSFRQDHGRLSSEVSPGSTRKPHPGTRAPGTGIKPKRKRTQFTDEQRGKMQAYAEHAGWTIVGQRKENIATACKDIGVTPKTLKYWIHNAKQKLKRLNELPV